MDDEVPIIPVRQCDSASGVSAGEGAADGVILQKTYAGLRVLALAVFMGIWADLLLRARPYGLNVPLWVCALAACMWVLARLHGRRLSPLQHGLLAAACVFSAMLAWRDAQMLRALDLGAAVIALALAAVPESLMGAPLTRAGFIQYARSAGMAALKGVEGAGELVMKDIRWTAIPGEGTAGQFKAAGLGILVTVPVLAVFGVLLTRADAAFESTLTGLFQFDAATLMTHGLVLFTGAWVSAGLLRLLVPLFAPKVPDGFLAPPKWSLNSLTVCIPLALTNLLFLSFIAVQLQQLFGGHAWVQNPDGPTYSEYARRGFIELAMVVSLALPLLLISDWSLRDESKGGRRVFRGLSAATLLMLLVISASALHRMALYMDAYGLTRLRFYTTAFMLWLIVLTLWFAVTILRERGQHFTFGVLVTGLVAILVLNVANPDWCIAQTNLKRTQEGKKIDGDYLMTLSADATAAFLSMPVTSIQGREQKIDPAFRWFHRELPAPSGDIRTWNWSRSHGRQIMKPPQEGQQPG